MFRVSVFVWEGIMEGHVLNPTDHEQPIKYIVTVTDTHDLLL